MKVFVTGASGFVGSHVAERLAASGHDVCAMARSEDSEQKVARWGATPVRCSLGSVQATHLDGVDVIVHCAAFVEEYGTREQFWEANVTGTTQLIEAAQQAGVRRFVHIGTEAAVWDGGPLVDADETHPYPQQHAFLYSESKAAAEQAVLAANSPDFATTSVRPCFVWGPRDNTLLPAIKRMADEGGWVWLDGGQRLTSTTHIYNLVKGIELALDTEHTGEAFFVADDGTSTMRDFVSGMAAATDIVLPGRSAPGWLVRPLGRLLEGTWRMLGLTSTPPLSYFAVCAMSRDKTIRTDKAKRLLGYEPVITREDGMATLRPGA